MPGAQLGAHFKAALKALRWSQREVAESVGVSERLVREFERGVRSNMSVDTALRLLAHVGVSMHLAGTGSLPVRVKVPGTEEQSRAARAQIRRSTLRVVKTRMTVADDEPPPPRSRAKRLASVAAVSATVYGFVVAGEAKRKRSHAR